MFGKVLKTITISLAAMAASGAAMADQCYTWGCITTLKDVLAYESGNIIVRADENTTVVNCGATQTNAASKTFRINGTSVGVDRMYASLLSAKTAEKRIKIRVNEGTNECYLQYVVAVDQ